MKHSFCKSMLAAFASLALLGTSHAQIFDAPVASNAQISFGSLFWAWASPVAADGSFGAGSEVVINAARASEGWRLPTAAEMLGAPGATLFQFIGANVPFGGIDPVSGSRFDFGSSLLTGAAACAATYFSNMFSQCNWGNAPGSGGSLVVPWWGQAEAPIFAESLVVRVIPEPEIYAMLAAGLGLMGFVARRRKQQLAAA
jgi:hypothetical protein